MVFPIARTLRSPQQPSASAPAPKAADLAYPVTYGVEIEMEGVNSFEAARAVRSVVVGSLSNRLAQQVVSGVWKCVADGAMPEVLKVPDRKGRKWRVELEHDGIEVISPVLRNAQDLRHLQDIARALTKAGAYVTDNLGLHIHIGAGAFSPYQMAHLLVLVHRYESALYLALDVHARRRANWCGPLPDASVAAVARAAPASHATFEQAYRSEGDSNRYQSVNFENALAGTPEKNTIEFRIFNATLCPSAIACHVSLVMGLAARALEVPAVPRVGKQLALLPPFEAFLAHTLDASTSTRLVANLKNFSRHIARATPRLAAALADEKYTGTLSKMLAAGIAGEELEQWIISTSPQTRDAFVSAARDLLLLRRHSASRPLIFALLQTVPPASLASFAASLKRLLVGRGGPTYSDDIVRKVMSWPASRREAILASCEHLHWACLLAATPSALLGLHERLQILGLASLCGPESTLPVYLIENLARAAADMPASDLHTFAATMSTCCSALDNVYFDPHFLRSTLATLPVHKLQGLAQRLQAQGPDDIDLDDPLVYVSPQRSQAIARAIERLQLESPGHEVPALLYESTRRLKEMLVDATDESLGPSVEALLALQQKCRGYLNLSMALAYWEGHSAASLRFVRDYIARTNFAPEADFRDICYQAGEALRAIGS